MNPNTALPDSAFWRRSVGSVPPHEVDPVTDVPFQIGRTDRVATAGSCFAQHISRTLLAGGFRYLVTESGPLSQAAIDEGFGVFPARFGNIYTVRQLLQLFQRAYGLFDPVDTAWQRSDGAWIDPFRPRVQTAGYSTPDAVVQDRDRHLGAVRAMFEQCQVFVFTLVLTEAWVSLRDGSVFPLAPGVVGEIENPADYAFKNFEVTEIVADLQTFVDWVQRINPGLRIVFTVSPVPLIATYEPRHVLVATTYSKAVLRVAADTISRTRSLVAYFPSYEIITGPQAGGRYYEADLREISPAGVAHVMELFRRHFLNEAAAPTTITAPPPAPTNGAANLLERRLAQIQNIICDEEAIEEAREAEAAQP